MGAYLLDMVSDRPLSDPGVSERPLQDAFPYYDISVVRKHRYFEPHVERWVRHNALANPAVKHYTGGIRAQVFPMTDVYLTKHPLVFLDGRTQLVHQHFVDYASIADVTAVLYHYKFVPGFTDKVDEAVHSKAYAGDSWDYRQYQRVLSVQPDLYLKTATAKTLRGVDDLVADGFLQVTDAYREWAGRPALRGAS